jgi:hypothetical protein
MHWLATGGVEPTEAICGAGLKVALLPLALDRNVFPKEMLQDAEALYGHLKNITALLKAGRFKPDGVRVLFTT